MKVLVVHNAYRQPGGEDGVVQSEVDLLREHGDEVELFSRHNDEITGLGRGEAALQTIWSRESAHRMSMALRRFRPEVVHVHNSFALISPSVYWACAATGIPIVQTLHNFRLLCPQAMLLRDGKVCEDCVGKVPWRAVVRRCYGNSHAQSAVLASMLTLHRSIGTFHKKVTLYIALNEFCRRKFIEGGLPSELVDVKPNFVRAEALTEGPREGFVFVGRLSHEKGVQVLAAAAALDGLRVRAAGDGPLMESLRAQGDLVLLGRLSQDKVREEMSRALAVVIPSLCYESMPLTLLEAFACGAPVVASRLGVLAELVEHGRTGLLFEPGDARDLQRMLAWAQANPESMLEMGFNARRVYEELYTPDANYQLLMRIYRVALSAGAARGASGTRTATN